MPQQEVNRMGDKSVNGLIKNVSNKETVYKVKDYE